MALPSTHSDCSWAGLDYGLLFVPWDLSSIGYDLVGYCSRVVEGAVSHFREAECCFVSTRFIVLFPCKWPVHITATSQMVGNTLSILAFYMYGLVINYCIILHTKNCKPSFAHPLLIISTGKHIWWQITMKMLKLWQGANLCRFIWAPFFAN